MKNLNKLLIGGLLLLCSSCASGFSQGFNQGYNQSYRSQGYTYVQPQQGTTQTIATRVGNTTWVNTYSNGQVRTQSITKVGGTKYVNSY